jgi:helix-turn-helix protein
MSNPIEVFTAQKIQKNTYFRSQETVGGSVLIELQQQDPEMIKIKISQEVFAVLQSKKWPHETQRNAVERAIMQLENIKFGE